MLYIVLVLCANFAAAAQEVMDVCIMLRLPLCCYMLVFKHAEVLMIDSFCLNLVLFKISWKLKLKKNNL